METQNRRHYKTVILSDIHLGSEYSKSREVINLLKSIDCDKLILNGDIIDGWQLKKSHKHWNPEHTLFFRVLMKMMENCNTEIILVRGNHDDFLDKLIPFNFGKLSIVMDYVLISNGMRYYVTHGDLFDTITTNFKYLSILGDYAYTALLHINKYYNKYRAWRNKPYYSLSQKIKHQVKGAVNYISDFRNSLVNLARIRNFDGVICGHIHQASNEVFQGVHYMNSGDWVESMSALFEDDEGNWIVETYSEDKYGSINDNEDKAIYRLSV